MKYIKNNLNEQFPTFCIQNTKIPDQNIVIFFSEAQTGLVYTRNICNVCFYIQNLLELMESVGAF